MFGVKTVEVCGLCDYETKVFYPTKRNTILWGKKAFEHDSIAGFEVAEDDSDHFLFTCKGCSVTVRKNL